ncbi:RNA polymerase sigma factor (plasmid) [Skermanella rosea]|jgi:RNA polymerase sigma-70 factor, ECF subfamily|uniref:RNA polymerase sigma factor n=1 Tax=Skermanella rosea TaxID=1817965 RepID=UPI0019327BD8|nr:RNA polymerase sigma factor [Skermanella rosea]UEM07923.1 RNA polymerase sigma factor [Skermanella rosea]
MKTTEDHIRSNLVPLYPRLKRFAVSLTGSLDSAEDLVQHACERALERSEQWTPGTRLDNWLYCIMHRAWIDEQRSAFRRTRAPLDEASDVECGEGATAAENLLMLDAVYRTLLQLPEEQRSVLTLVCVDGLSYKETAQILGICVGTVMSRVSRGRIALAKRIEEPSSRSDNIVKLW